MQNIASLLLRRNREMTLTPFKRGLMRALLEEKNCLKELQRIRNEVADKSYEYERKALSLREEQTEVEELILHLFGETEK